MIGSNHPTVNATNFGTGTSVTFTDGVASSVPMVLYNSNESQARSISATASGITTSTPLSVTVNPSTATGITITAASSTPIAGAADQLTLTAYDTYGNVATGYNATDNFTFSGASNGPNGDHPTVTNDVPTAINFGSTTAISFSNGVANQASQGGTMVLYKAGSTTLSATDSSDSLPVTGATVTVSPATASDFTITGSAGQIAGATNNLTITALDTYGNTVNSGTNDYTGSETLTFSGSSAIGSNHPTVNATNFGTGTSVTFTDGVASSVPMVLYNSNESQARSISATASGITTSSR